MTPDQVSDWRKEALIDSKRMELERAVIETVVADRKMTLGNGEYGNAEVDEMIQSRAKMNQAIDALIELESEHPELMTLERK